MRLFLNDEKLFIEDLVETEKVSRSLEEMRLFEMFVRNIFSELQSFCNSRNTFQAF